MEPKGRKTLRNSGISKDDELVAKAMSAADFDKLKDTGILENKNARDWDTTEFENNPQSP